MREHLAKYLFLAISIALLACVECALAQDHLSDLDSVRTSMTDIGYKLPDAIKSAKPEDVRTLRVFEINN